jgi:phage minor structural protein
MILWACDRWEAYKGPIKTLFECEDTREVNGENALSITTLARLDKGDRLVWRDLKGRWHENIVDGVEEERASAGILYTYYCPTSAQIELLGDYLEDKRPYDVSAYAALASAPSSSRWQVGTVADLGQAGTNFYHTNAWAAIHDVADTWGGELSFEIQVIGTKVTARRVCMAKQVGEDNGKRFTYAKDLVSVKRSVDEGNVCTALYGYGKSLQTADEDGNLTGGYDRKLTFGDVNGGQNWVGSADALARWGRPDGKGGKAHVFGDVEFSDCEDAAELKKLTEAQLAKSCVPTVSYTVDAVALARAGEGFEGADEGDLVTVVDKVYDPPLRVRTRITKVVEDQLRPGEVTYTFGNYQTVAELMAAQKSAAKSTASTIRATVTEAVNASNKASTGKWGESLAAAEERQKAYAKEVGGGAQDYTDQIRDELDKALKEYTDTSIEQSESVLKQIDEANKEYLEGVTGKLDERLTSAEGEVDGLQKQLDQLPTDIRKKIVDMLNSEVNATGGWVYEEPGQGILVYDKKPESATKCVKIGGGIIGVANSKYSSGAWKWRTAITGDGVTADELTTGRIKGGNSYWDLDSGAFYLRDGSIFMTDSNGNRVYINATNGFQIYDKNGSIIAGTVLVGSTSMFRCNMVGTSSTNYITTGTTTNNHPGASFVNGSTEYCTIEAVHAKDSPTASSTDGVGISACGYGFLAVNRYYLQTWLTTPYYAGYMSHPDEQLYMKSGNSNAGGSAYVKLQKNSNNYVYLDSSRADIGSSGTARILAPKFAIGTNPSSGGTYGYTGSTQFIGCIANNGNSWTWGTINVVNGIITGMSSITGN